MNYYSNLTPYQQQFLEDLTNGKILSQPLAARRRNYTSHKKEELAAALEQQMQIQTSRNTVEQILRNH